MTSLLSFPFLVKKTSLHSICYLIYSKKNVCSCVEVMIMERKMKEYTEDVNIPIQLEAVCSTKGDFTPRWFRYENKEHQIERIVVEKILSQKEINFVGVKIIQYICCSTVNSCERIFEIRYHVSSHKWTFFRMLS